MLTDFDISIGSGLAHPAQQGDGKFQGFTGLESQSPKGDPAFIGHEEAEAEKSEPNRKSQTNHLFVQQSVDIFPESVVDHPKSKQQAAIPACKNSGWRVRSGSSGSRGVGACGELGKAHAEGEQKQRENHHQFTTSRHFSFIGRNSYISP